MFTTKTTQKPTKKFKTIEDIIKYYRRLHNGKGQTINGS